MNPVYRFELASKCIYFMVEDGEIVCSFKEAIRQINLLTANPTVLSNLYTRVEERIRLGEKYTDLANLIQLYKESGYTGAFFTFLYQSLSQFAIFHNQKYMKKITLERVKKHIQKHVAPELDELARMPATFSKENTEFRPHSLPSLSKVYTEVLNDKIYYGSPLSVLAFLYMFRDILSSMHLTIRACTVCGELFCTAMDEKCCGSTDCKEFLETASPSHKKDTLSEITRKFSNRVRKHRSDIREACESAEAVLAFNAFASPKQEYVIEKARELRRTDAPNKQILQLKKEVKEIYTQINEKKKEILAQYSIQ